MLAADWQWCWSDPVCISVSTSAACALAEFARRLNPGDGERIPQDWGGFARYVASGTITAALAAGTLCVGWYLIFPSQLLLGFVITMLGGVAIGWGSDEGIGVVRRIWRKVIDRILPDDKSERPPKT